MSNEREQQSYDKGRLTAKFAQTRGQSTVANVLQYWHDHASTLADALGWPLEKLQAELTAFDRERLDAEPSLTTYPELRGYRDRLLAEERGMLDGGLTPLHVAMIRSFNFYRDVRLQQTTGRAWSSRPTTVEKCRVLYLADSDRGPLHLKNIDDPLRYWTPKAPVPQDTPWPHGGPLWIDGVGSGLHIDEIPPEIFPVDARALCLEVCETIDQAREFLLRYNYFWASCNIVLHDQLGNSLAFEKTRCRVAVREPNAAGINFVTGMGALDPEIRAHQQAMRQRYLDQQGWTWDDPDGAFWKECDAKWENMTRYVGELAERPTFDGAMALMERRDATGPMCLTGSKCHPAQEHPGCTLCMDAWVIDDKTLYRRQWRGDTPAYLDDFEIVQFS